MLHTARLACMTDAFAADSSSSETAVSIRNRYAGGCGAACRVSLYSIVQYEAYSSAGCPDGRGGRGGRRVSKARRDCAWL
eukprot:133901-Chlamydomonas_euryale.AAC.5